MVIIYITIYSRKRDYKDKLFLNRNNLFRDFATTYYSSAHYRDTLYPTFLYETIHAFPQYYTGTVKEAKILYDLSLTSS